MKPTQKQKELMLNTHKRGEELTKFMKDNKFEAHLCIYELPNMSDKRVKDVIEFLRIIANGLEKTPKTLWATLIERNLLKK